MNRIKDFIKSHWMLAKPVLLFIRWFVFPMIRLPFILVAIVKAPIFLTRNRKMFKNEIVYLFWNVSFGHQIMSYDYASRLYWPNRISLIEILWPRNNPYLAYCFKHNIDAFSYKSLLFKRSYLWAQVSYFVLRFYCLLISALTNKFQVIDRLDTYKTLSIAETQLKIGDRTATKLIDYYDPTGYIRLLRENIGKKPTIQEEFYTQCFDLIKKHAPNFLNREFITLLLRDKGRDSESWTDKIRNTGPHEYYLPAVEYIVEKGYHVLGLGETEHEIFKDVSGYFSLDDVGIDPYLLNIYGLTQCKYFIGQQSGPYILPESINKKCLIIDNVYPSYGTYNNKTYLANKKISFRGKCLSNEAIYTEHLNASYGIKLDEYIFSPLSSKEILYSVKTFLNNKKDNLFDINLITDKRMRIFYSKNRVINL